MSYSPDDFAAIKAPPKDPPTDIRWEDGVDAETAYKKALAGGLTKKAAKLLNSHGALKYDSASEADFALMGYLYRARLSPSENAAVIFLHPRGDDIRRRHPDAWAYMKISLGKLYRNGPEPDSEEPPPATPLQSVERTFAKWLLLKDFKGLHAVLAGVAAHRAGGEGTWIFLIDAPGSGKTEIIRSLNALKDVFTLSSLTPQTLTSGQRLSDTSKDPSLLLRLPSECVLCMKDFTTVLSMHRDARQEILGQLREIADGYFSREYGTGKTVKWEGRLCFVAGVTPAIDTHWSVNSILGERFVQVRPQPPDPLKLAQRSMRNVGKDRVMREEMRAAVTGLLDNLKYPPIDEVTLSEEMEARLAALATFAVRARSAVTRDGYKREITYIPQPEAPGRLARQLATLARGRAILDGRRAVSEDDCNEIVEIGFDCIAPHRWRVLETLVEVESMSTPSIATVTGYPTNSARIILEDLTAIGLLGREKTPQADLWRITDSAESWYRAICVHEKSTRGGKEKL